MDVGLPISVVARQLSMATSTLRTWHQRYGLGASIRSRGGHRRYTSEDLHRLRAAAQFAHERHARKRAADVGGEKCRFGIRGRLVDNVGQTPSSQRPGTSASACAGASD